MPMETIATCYDSKDRRSQSCLETSSSINTDDNRTFSLTKPRTMDSSNELKQTFDRSLESIEKHSTPKHELYKLHKEFYQNAKRKITSELDQILKDPSAVIMSDWLKVRGKLRDWTKFWVVLKPGLLLLYRSSLLTNNVWVGTIVLSSCEVMERPSKKAGFCFKIWHLLEKSIWTQKGPNNEQFGALTFPLPINYLICRASDQAAGRCWLDALELTIKCSKLLKRPYSTASASDTLSTSLTSNSSVISTDDNNNDGSLSEFDSDSNRVSLEDRSVTRREERNEIEYIAAPTEEMGELGNATQTEDVAEENKSLIMHLLKQVRPGMDLSRVVLPTFILEPRSLLEKLSDYYHHCDILEEAVNASDPMERMKTVLRFYLSGFYKKPKGLKKPYNPILGERYRCYFQHTKSDSKTFYIAEQISHHPPITNFHVSNRQEGFCVQGSVLARSKFYGNSVCAMLDGSARLTLLNQEEDYLITMPYASCKGILIGRLTMELGGKVTIVCEKTRYSTEIEFKLKPFIGSQDLINLIEGRIRFDKDILYTFSGHWDDEIILVDKSTNIKSVLWKVTQPMISSRLKRYVVPIEQQQDNESEKLWLRVTLAIQQNDQLLATEEKTRLEDEQRRQIKERKAAGIPWQPQLFHINPTTKEWTYTHADVDSWNTQTAYTHLSVNHDGMPSISGNDPSTDDGDLTSILKRIGQNLRRLNEQISGHERRLYDLQNHQTAIVRNHRSLLSPSIQLLLIILLFITLKYLFP